MKLKSLNFALTHEVSHKRPTNPDLTSLPALHGIACTYIAGLSHRTQTRTHTKTHRDTHKRKKKESCAKCRDKKAERICDAHMFSISKKGAMWLTLPYLQTRTPTNSALCNFKSGLTISHVEG